MMFKLYRIAPNGKESFKKFKNKKELLHWLGDESVSKDEEEGYTFQIIELGE